MNRHFQDENGHKIFRTTDYNTLVTTYKHNINFYYTYVVLALNRNRKRWRGISGSDMYPCLENWNTKNLSAPKEHFKWNLFISLKI